MTVENSTMNADDKMLADHQRMWHDFCNLMKWSIGGAVIVLGIVLFLAAR
jgi:hypothetical protein